MEPELEGMLKKILTANDGQPAVNNRDTQGEKNG
jgi:hypothetical protein